MEENIVRSALIKNFITSVISQILCISYGKCAGFAFRPRFTLQFLTSTNIIACNTYLSQTTINALNSNRR